MEIDTRAVSAQDLLRLSSNNELLMSTIDFNQVDLDSIRLPPGEDFCIKSQDEDEKEDALEFESGFGNIIVVDNLPVVPPEKYEKLETLGTKVFGCYQIPKLRRHGAIVSSSTATLRRHKRHVMKQMDAS